jgi:GNAT superfamily N-acetyltransferase
MNELRIELIAVGTAAHREAMQLRERVLRIPLGLPGLSPEELVHEPDSVHFVCLAGKRVVGTMLLVAEGGGEDGARTLRMRQVAVAPELQGQGIGKLLVERAEAHARAEGAQMLIAHARAAVVPFYEHLGYRAVGEPFIEVTIEHRVVEKLLV